MADSPLVLDLTTNTPRKQVRIDGIGYDVRLQEDLTLFEGHQLNVLMKQLTDIESLGAAMTEEQGAQYDELLARLVRFGLPDVPERVVASLSTGKRKAVVVTFFMLSALSGHVVRANTLKAAAAHSSGTKRYRASRGTTAARRRTGSKRRSASFART